MKRAISTETRSYDMEVKADAGTLQTAFSETEEFSKNEVESTAHQSFGVTAFEVTKYAYSLVLLVFSFIVVMAAIVTDQANATEYSIPKGVAIPLFCFLLIWLGVIEGGQGALVGLQTTPKDQYAQSHPISLKCTELAHDGDNMERFIVGRQFLVVLLIFTINMCGAAVGGADVLNMGSTMNSIFLAEALAMILVTVNIGQLAAQVNAADCMLDFINNYFMLFSTHFSLAIEYSGLLHSVYLVQYIFSAITGQPIETNEPERSGFKSLLFWGRVLLSLTILGFSLAVVFEALVKGWTGMWEGVPSWAAMVIVFGVLLPFVGVMEGMQIAAFAVVKMDEEEYRNTHKIAHANCQLLFKGDNLGRFLIGRQLCVCSCMFVAARCFSISKGHADIVAGDTSLFASAGFQDFINTGLLGAVVTTILGCLIWRIIASSYPLMFLSNPIIYAIIKLCLALEFTGLCSASWVLGKFMKDSPLFPEYQPDAVRLEGAAPKVTRRDMDIDLSITVIKYGYSIALLTFSFVIVMAAIATDQANAAEYSIPKGVAIGLFCFLLLWLSMIEGGQGALVALQETPKDQYAQSHPISLKCTELAHDGDNMERFIVGRQFLVVLIIFTLNMCGAAVGGADVLNLSSELNTIFLAEALAMILVTVNLGQLTAQVNAADCMLDFINNHFMLFSTYFSLAIEYSGLLHSVYLVQYIFSAITGQPIETNEPERSGAKNAFFWGRVVMSLAILGFSLAVVFDALVKGWTGMWEGVPSWAAMVIVFGVLLPFVGIMEGMQIAAFAVVKMDEEEYRNTHKIAHANCQLLFKGKNLGRFLIGRQLCVCSCMFVAARCFSINKDHADIIAGSTSFAASDGFQDFINTGLLGAVVTTILGCLIWRIIASSYPLMFLSNPIIYVVIKLCLLLESTGICSASWALGAVHRKVAGFQPDEAYIGLATEDHDDLELAA
ncbi:hypothetical protein TrST_g10032 [Triparma strigata]|uniref:Silicon transporter n=1 Tax=Triparma strigata TaxID=1606541 RepID=A0A9W7B878_9STRA|nr:hypothetical protein TrST_g10032 [Triparma strigata]